MEAVAACSWQMFKKETSMDQILHDVQRVLAMVNELFP